ncbi:uncharacterized protein [Procambarus clarkii]|uniref:uncharacterized protein isoform X2 n=1 Tax=Procambarus clarkii TaxID=6728 RepID=UPI00374388EB
MLACVTFDPEPPRSLHKLVNWTKIHERFTYETYTSFLNHGDFIYIFYHKRGRTFTMLTSIYTFSSDLHGQGVTSVWAVSGGRAELPCPPSPKVVDDQPLLVLWYLSSNTFPVYSYDARVGEFEAGQRWANEGVLGGRAFFTAHAHPPTLVLEPAHAHDQGLYTCRVDYRLSPSTTSVVNLTVVIPAGPPVVLWGGVGVPGDLGPLGEGEMVQVVCRSVGGRPPPVLTWWWRGSRLPNQVTSSTTNPTSEATSVQATVVVEATREMQAATLTCHAHTPAPTHANAILQPRSTSVTLNITLPPLEVRILGSGGPVSAGQTLRLVCRAVGSHPPAQVTWWRGHSRLTHVSHAYEEGGKVTTATLTVEVDRDHDGATLACTATNPHLPSLTLTHSIKLKVYYTPVVSLALSRHLDASLVKEGDDVFFECSIRANPVINRIDWYHNGAEVVHKVSEGVVVSGLSLVLRRLRRRHSGSYTCAAANMQGRNTSNAVHLTVRSDSPVCAGGVLQRVQGVARGTPTIITCMVEADPAQGVTWEWVRRLENGIERQVADQSVRKDGLSSSVVVTPLMPEDYGEVLCRAGNTIGRQRTPCVVTLVPAGPPDTPANCSATPTVRTDQEYSAHTSSLTVTCYEGFDGGFPQEFLLEAWQDGENMANITSDFPEWVVGGLVGGTGVTLRVTALNARGRSETLRLEVHTASAQHRAAHDTESAAVGVPAMLGAVVGVAAVLLLLLVVSVVIARHAPPHKNANGPHDHMRAVTSAGDGWECYDPDLVSSSQCQHPSLGVVANAHHQHQSLAHARAQTATHIQTKAQTHTQTLPNTKHTNGQVVKCVDHTQEVAAVSHESEPSSDSDVESVVEVTNSTPVGRPQRTDKTTYRAVPTREPGQPTAGVAPCLTPAHSNDPLNRDRPHTTEIDASLMPLTKGTDVYAPNCAPASAERITNSPKTFKASKGMTKNSKTRNSRKLVRFVDNNENNKMSEFRLHKDGQTESQGATAYIKPAKSTSVIILSKEEKNKKSSEMTPPPKPPRAINPTLVSDTKVALGINPSSSLLARHSGKPRLSPPTEHTSAPGVSSSTSPRTAEQPTPAEQAAPCGNLHNTNVAPLAEDEVRDAYSSVRETDKGRTSTGHANLGIIESAM